MAEPHTDERFVPGHGGPGIHLEHVHRYRVAAAVVEGRVLDLGCGSGYGSRLLSESCPFVVGVDRSPEAIHFARTQYGGPGIRHSRADVRDLPFADRTFDSVVCFELIEHVEEHRRVLSEARRMLRPGGILLISTPNRPEYSEKPGYENPFHEQEWDFEEFTGMLQDVFPHVQLWGQRLVAGSRIWNFNVDDTAGGTWTYPLGKTDAAELHPARVPMYFLAACSTRALRSRVTSKIPSVLGGRLETFLEEHRAKLESYSKEAAARYEAEVAKLRNHLTHYQTQNDELREWTSRQQEALETLKTRNEQLEAQSAQAGTRHTVLEVEAARERERLEAEAHRRERAEAEAARAMETVRAERELRTKAEDQGRQHQRQIEEERRRGQAAIEAMARERRQREDAEARLAAEATRAQDALQRHAVAREEATRERARGEQAEQRLHDEVQRTEEERALRRTAEEQVAAEREVRRAAEERAEDAVREATRHLAAEQGQRTAAEREAMREREARVAAEEAAREAVDQLEAERGERRVGEVELARERERREESESRGIQERERREVAEARVRDEARRREQAEAHAAQERERCEELEAGVRSESRWRFEERRRREAGEQRLRREEERHRATAERLRAEEERAEREACQREALTEQLLEETAAREALTARLDELARELGDERRRREDLEERIMFERGGRLAAEEESRFRGRQLDEERARLHSTESEMARGWDEVNAMRATKVWKLMLAYHRLQAIGRATGGWLRRAFLWTVISPARLLGGSFLLASLAREEVVARLWGPRRRLRTLPPPPSPAPATREGRRPRVLIVSPYKVHPPDHGGGVRIFNLVRRLAADCDVHLLVFNQAGDDPAQREALSSYCRSVHFHHWRPSFHPDLLGLRPPNAQLFASEEAAHQIREILNAHGIDILQLEYTELGQFARAGNGVPVVLTEHDIARRQHQRRRKLAFHKRYPEGNDFGSTFFDWVRTSRYELAVCRRADRILTMSEDDASFLASYLRDGRTRIRIAPNAVDTESYDPAAGNEERKGILFLGNYQNLPNVDGLEYFLADVWPLVRLRCPEATLTVAGANPSARVLRVHGRDGVSVIGRVPDLRQTYREHRLMVAPLRVGSGTRLKILEAFSSGLPVVSTTIGAEGIECEHGKHLLLADTPGALAREVELLLRDDALCRELARNARILAEEQYDWGLSARRCLETYRELLNGHPGSTGGPPPAKAVEHASPRLPLRTPSAPPTNGKKHPDISIVIPTRNGGALLERVLERVFAQETTRRFDVVCVDSASRPEDLERMRRFPVRIEGIDPATFNHGLTRDLGAELSDGDVIVFINQDALPADTHWLQSLTDPLFAGDPRLAGVQGGIREVDDRRARFFWDSCGPRFYFTRESHRWIAAHRGIGFSTVNAAMRREVWRAHPFGWAPIMEDKKWQQVIVESGFDIAARHEACVIHTHDYNLRSLVRRCESEGYGWRTLGETYPLRSMVADMATPRVHLELLGGLFRGRVRTPAELLFPLLRPLALYRGNHFGQGVKS